MSASHSTNARSRRARSSEDESPLIVTFVAILGIVVLGCAALIAPALWSALEGPQPRWSEQSCNQESGAADAARCADIARLQAFRPRPKLQHELLIPRL
jgi:hypothetical protein